MKEVMTLSTSTEIRHAVDQFQIAQNYFSSIIGVQTAIFSLIVAAIVTLYFLFNWKISRDYIKAEMETNFSKLKEKSDKEFNEKMENLQSIFSTGMAQHEVAISRLSGSNYRALGYFFDSEKQYSTAFIWWFRAAHEFSKVPQDNLTRICLSGAKNSIERVKYGFELNTDTIGEYQKLLPDISDVYKIEKDMLDKAFKTTLTKDSPTTTIEL
jgi:hypothetical protein